MEKALVIPPQAGTGHGGMPVTLRVAARLRIDYVRRKSSSDPGITHEPLFYLGARITRRLESPTSRQGDVLVHRRAMGAVDPTRRWIPSIRPLRQNSHHCRAWSLVKSESDSHASSSFKFI
jgi:hypothetical protein